MSELHSNFYRLPHYYDILHSPGTAGDVDAMERIERRFGSAGTRGVWLEPACGTGRYLVLAGKRGRRCFGFDLEPPMVAFANDRVARLGLGRRVSIFQADMRSFDRDAKAPKLPPISLAFNLINTIRHLDSDDAMLEHFAAIARVLKPSGVYAVGISLAAYGAEFETEDVWKGSRGGCAVTQVVQYIPPPGKYGGHRRERVLSHLTIRRPRGDEHVDSTYTLRSYNLKQWQALIERSALRVVGVVDHAGRDTKATEPGYAIFVLGQCRVEAR
jgi:SAM-dependent methyltransferase